MPRTPCSSAFPIRRLTRWRRRISAAAPLTRGWRNWAMRRSMPCVRKLRCRRLSRMVLAAWHSLLAAWPMPRRACLVRRSPVSVPAGVQAVRCRVCRSAVATCASSMLSRACASTATRASFVPPTFATAPTSCFGASRDERPRGSLARVFPVRFAPVAAPFPRLRHRFHSTTQRLTYLQRRPHRCRWRRQDLGRAG